MNAPEIHFYRVEKVQGWRKGGTRFLERKHETLRVSGKELYAVVAGLYSVYDIVF